jgi:hypothetical protein
VLLRWGLQRGTSVLPKSTNPGRIQSNLEIVDWQLSAADMEALSGLEVQTRSVVGSYWLNKEVGWDWVGLELGLGGVWLVWGGVGLGWVGIAVGWGCVGVARG